MPFAQPLLLFGYEWLTNVVLTRRLICHGTRVYHNQPSLNMVCGQGPQSFSCAGATAGAAAVLASMPADCVKTVLEMETGGAARGPLGDAGHFVATARGMLQRGGPGALFIGMGPRLAETVRRSQFRRLGSMLCLGRMHPNQACAECICMRDNQTCWSAVRPWQTRPPCYHTPA